MIRSPGDPLAALAEQVSARVAERAAAPPRLAVSMTEAAEMLGVSLDFFTGHIAPELRIVRSGRRKIVPVRELERWLDRSAERAGARRDDQRKDSPVRAPTR